MTINEVGAVVQISDWNGSVNSARWVILIGVGARQMVLGKRGRKPDATGPNRYRSRIVVGEDQALNITGVHGAADWPHVFDR
jgi:hypothetical protein